MKKEVEKEFLEAYESYSDALFRFCYFKTNDKELALDLVSDVFLKAWAYVQEGKEVKNFRPFLYRIADNMVIDWYRKKKAVSLDALHEDGFDPVDTRAQSDEYAQVQEAMALLSRLEDGDRAIILMRYVDELSPKEIAEVFDQTENNISVRIHRALKRLRSLIP